MDNWGLTDKGFRRKSYPDILDDLILKSRELFGEDINVTSRSALGLLLRLFAWGLALVWQLAEKVYLSGFMSTSEGIDKDRHAQSLGIIRLGKRPATGYITVYGEDGTEIEEGFIVANKRGTEYRTFTNYVIEKGEAKVYVESIEVGKETNSEIEEVTEIITPVAGIDRVENLEPILGGADEETDAELQQRYNESLSKAGASTTASITASVLDVEGVTSVIVDENDTEETNEEGIPPHSIAVYVVGGDKNTIAMTILNTKAGGIQAYGDTKVKVKDVSGTEREIGFTYAEENKVNVEVDVVTDSNYHRLGDTKVKDTVIAFLGGVDSQGAEHKGLKIGEDVIISQIVRELWKIEGIVDVTVKIGFDEVASENLTIGRKQVAITGNVVVNHV